MTKMNKQERPYQPINAYGVIGDCHSVLLIAPDGSVDWGCLPDFDSPAIFCRSLDAERGGYFQVAPTDPAITGSQRYLRGSNVLQTTFAGNTGKVSLTDFMPVETLSPCSYRALNNNTWMQQNGSCHCLVRHVSCIEGELPITMTLKVTPNYAASPSEVTITPDEPGAVISGGGQYVGLFIAGAHRVSAFSLHLSQDDTNPHPSVIAQITLHEGERIQFVLGVGRTLEAARRLVTVELPQRNFDWELAYTLSCWRQWIAGCNYAGPYRDWIERSALALKMLIYAPTGAIVAAPTTSLPEGEQGERNWDYRFTWLRDAAFTLCALSSLGFTEETRAFTCWLLRLSYEDGEDLQIMYGIRGERDLTERELTHLSGYRGSQPVRIGNKASEQRQLDVFGEVLDCIYMYWSQSCLTRSGEKPGDPLWNLMCELIEYVCAHWQEKDCGIWEVRGSMRHFVYSKVMCWVALDRGIKAAQQFHLEADLSRWSMVRDQIRTDILLHGYDSTIQAFTQTYDGIALDASNLLLPLVGFIAPDDPRMRSTVDRTMEQLTDNQSFVYRYRNYDGLLGTEGTFTVCTFWLIDNLILQERLAEATTLFKRVLTCAGPLGLFSEQIKQGSNIALGNYPQALTHIALINSAVNLHHAEEHTTSSKSA
jgi:GH15 family glucan-1,4-alpha-glucosidase